MGKGTKEAVDGKKQQKPQINDLKGDFNGAKIIPHIESRHNPIHIRTISVFPQELSLEQEVKIGADIKL